MSAKIALFGLLGLGTATLSGCAQEEPKDAEAEPAAAPTAAPTAASTETTPPADAELTPLERGMVFLAKNGKRPNVIATRSGLQYEVLASGTGEQPGPTDYVTTHYHGTLVDGSVFDSSVLRDEPIEFRVNGVIQGWQEALQLMHVGDKWKLYIPASLAYGKRGSGSIGPDETLIFEVELLELRRS